LRPGVSHVPTAIPGAEEYFNRLAARAVLAARGSRTARLGIRLDEFPAWACAHLESELASINELARTLRDNGEADALVRQIDDRIAELKIRRSGENAAEVPF